VDLCLCLKLGGTVPVAGRAGSVAGRTVPEVGGAVPLIGSW
jgi:hypothetical protein